MTRNELIGSTEYVKATVECFISLKTKKEAIKKLTDFILEHRTEYASLHPSTEWVSVVEKIKEDLKEECVIGDYDAGWQAAMKQVLSWFSELPAPPSKP